MFSISVIIPTYNRRELLLRAINSVITQTSAADEIIVIDNGSERVRESDLPPGVKLLPSPIAAGASQARNIGASMARSEYLAFLDDDDYWANDVLEAVRDKLSSSNPAHLLITALYNSANQQIIPSKNDALNGTLLSLLRRNPGVVGSSITIERESFYLLGGFDTHLPASEDIDLFIRAIYGKLKIERVPEARVYYDSTHTRSRLSRIPILIKGKDIFLKKHITNPFLRWVLLVDYIARLTYTNIRRV